MSGIVRKASMRTSSRSASACRSRSSFRKVCSLCSVHAHAQLIIPQPVHKHDVDLASSSATGTSPEDTREAAGNAGLRAPYLCKPLWADGREGSHGLLVIRDEQGLEQLALGPRPSSPDFPLVLQQYVPHGACLFKVGSRPPCRLCL